MVQPFDDDEIDGPRLPEEAIAHLRVRRLRTLHTIQVSDGWLVALNQGSGLWPMFAFGFGAVFVLTQMHGLGLGQTTKRLLYALYVLAVLVSYGLMSRLTSVHEITRIPILEYGVVGLLYAVFLGVNGVGRLLGGRKPVPVEAAPEVREERP
jgi:hypothetical protein